MSEVPLYLSLTRALTSSLLPQHDAEAERMAKELEREVYPPFSRVIALFLPYSRVITPFKRVFPYSRVITLSRRVFPYSRVTTLFKRV